MSTTHTLLDPNSQQYHAAREAYTQHCKVCTWEVDSAGNPGVYHGAACYNVVPHVVNHNSNRVPDRVPDGTVVSANLNATPADGLAKAVDLDAAAEATGLKLMPDKEPVVGRMTIDRLQLHRSLFVQCAFDLSDKKNADYAGPNDPFFNLRRGGPYGVAVRLDDKVSRLLNLLKPGTEAQVEESVKDTLLDILNYAWLLAAMLDE